MDQTEIANILIVDDRPENLLVLESLLDGPDVAIYKANSGNEALKLVLEHEFALILMDVQMPEMDGFETAEIIRGHKSSRHIPIIFVTAISKGQKYVFKGYGAGAVDYLFKPLDPEILKCKVQVFLDLFRRTRDLQLTASELSRTVDSLENANRKILSQQRKIVEEERHRVLLQLAGATAHELNQPLMVLLGNLDMLRLNQKDPDKAARHMKRLGEAAQRISDITKKIQNIKSDEVTCYSGDASIIDIHQTVGLLWVDPSREGFEEFRNLVMKLDRVEVSHAPGITEALGELKKHKTDVVFVHEQVAGGFGMRLMDAMGQQDMDVPVIAVTDKWSERSEIHLIAAGAVNYLPMDSFSEQTLFGLISNVMENHRLKREIRETRKRMAEISDKDQVTGLFNRSFFIDKVGLEQGTTDRSESVMSLCLVDIDNFRTLNDTYGHHAGDVILAKVGLILKESVRFGDICCRYGDKEFAVLFPSTDSGRAEALMNRFCDRVVSRQFEFNHFRFEVSVSFGITSYRAGQSSSKDALLLEADQDLYQSKVKRKVRRVGMAG